MRGFAAIGPIASLLVIEPSHASVIPISGALEVEAVAGIAPFVAEDVDTDSASWTTVPADLSVSVNAFVDPSNAILGSAAAFADINASWSSASAGSVSFEDFGWVLLPGQGNPYASLSNLGQPLWTYAFVPTVDSLFTVQYFATTTASSPPRGGWTLRDGTVPILIVENVTPASNFSYALAAGQTYALSFTTNSSIGTNGIAIGSADAQFDWRIDPAGVPVPEPGVGALMLAGLGLIGWRRWSGRAAGRTWLGPPDLTLL